MKHLFEARGYQIVGETDPADVYVVNTCTVTGLADRKSRQYIRRMKKANQDAVIAATGCYVQTEPETLRQIEELDILLGTNHKYEIVDVVEERLARRAGRTGGAASGEPEEKVVRIDARQYLNEFVEAGKVTAPDGKTRANVKIEEGCDRYCTYCQIPTARGPVRSRKRENILRECRDLIEAGFKELILTGINTALYEDLPGLLSDLDHMDGDFRVRLASLEPTVVDAPFVARLIESERLCHHLHLSLQSGSDTVLKRMGRRYGRKEYLEIVNVLRDIDPLFNITTDIIVGFPGETEEEFRETLSLAEEVAFGKIHVFKYSRRPGTKAAVMPDQVPEPVKKERSARLQALGDRLMADYHRLHLGTEQRVLVEEQENGLWTGYTNDYTKAFIRSDEDLHDQFVTGSVVDADESGIIVIR
jgi:threonylcarbamoyladenosine tRNA methylthiotransferase MtaB